MTGAFDQALTIADRFERAPSAEAVGAVLLDELRPLGATSLWARSFRLTENWADPQVSRHYKTDDFARIRDSDWWGSQARFFSDGLCPLSIGSARFRRPFLATQVAAHDDGGYGAYWEAMDEFGVGDIFALPSIRLDGPAELLSIWLEDSSGLSPDDVTTIALASLIALEQMRARKAPATSPPTQSLSARERDCLAYVAEGKSDWEIGAILGISQTTAHSHIERSKKKLDATTRAQAVARAIRNQMI